MEPGPTQRMQKGFMLQSRMALFLLWICLGSVRLCAGQSTLIEAPLPQWLSRRERQRGPTVPPPQETQSKEPLDTPSRKLRYPTTAFSGQAYLRPEFDDHKAVLMAWTGYEAFANLIVAVAQAIASEDVEIWLIGGGPTLQGVPNDLYVSLDYPYNSVWVRDFGPLGIHRTPIQGPSQSPSMSLTPALAFSDAPSSVPSESPNQKTEVLEFVDPVYPLAPWRPLDDAIPCHVANAENVACQSTTLVFDGGNIMTDGQMNLFMTKVTYTWNPEMTTEEVDDALKEIFGVQIVHAIDYAVLDNGAPADGTGHIDMFAKLLDPRTVIISETTDPIFQPVMDSAASYFESMRCGRRKCFTVYRVPGWSMPSYYGLVWYSYTNSLIVGNSILVPGYSGGKDAAVMAIYQTAAPDKNITIINSDGVIGFGGSIHCLTMQIPVDPF